jgi:hypothetical protein
MERSTKKTPRNLNHIGIVFKPSRTYHETHKKLQTEPRALALAFAFAFALALALAFLVCHSRRESAFASAVAVAVACFSSSS